MITYVKGNLFNKPDPTGGVTHIIAHVANDMCVMGSGFAGELVKRYPIVKQMNTSTRLGDVELIPIADGMIVANMIAQHQTIRQNTKPIRYAALVWAMETVAEKCQSMDATEIHCPKFGSGLAKGRWDLIEELVSELWVDIPVFIYDLGR